jgi:beta-glucosidase
VRSPSILRVPPDFVWGAATSAYQIEGASLEDGKGASIWDTFCREPGRVAGGATGDVAIDHYHRHQDDIALLAELGHGAYRFSISWPRVMPQGHGTVNRAGLGFYDQLVDELLDAGLEPYPTLYHWDLPQALQDTGGWPERSTASRFADYAALVVQRLGDRVARWATLNEPWCAAFLGHASGVHAPGQRDARAAIAASHHLLLAHGLAVDAMRAARPSLDIGLVLNPAPVIGLDGVSDDTVRRVDGLRNRWFQDPVLTGAYPEDVLDDVAGVLDDLIEPGDLETISAPLEWLGVNYYHDLVFEPPVEPEPWPYPFAPPARLAAHTELVTDLRWPVTPAGLGDLLRHLRDTYPGLPRLAVTENGAAFTDPLIDGRVADDRRITYLTEHLEALASAMADGVDVFAYFVWSAFDNMEWHDGYGPRFGVIHVDYDTMARTPKDSALWLREVMDASRPPADAS